MTLNPFKAAREVAALRARIASLEFAIREANANLKSGEGVDLLYYWPADEARSFRALIAALIGKESA
jgi:hypothetical protein